MASILVFLSPQRCCCPQTAESSLKNAIPSSYFTIIPHRTKQIPVEHLLSFLRWIPSPAPVQLVPIPKYQLLIPRNTVYPEPSVATPTRIPEAFPISHHTLLRTRVSHRNQERKHPLNKDKARYQQVESQPSQTQMPRCQNKTTLTARTRCRH